MPGRTPWRVATITLLLSAAVGAESIDEIVVISDLRQRPLNEIASSITLLDEQQINELADQHFEELIKSLPNVNWSGDGHRARYLQIRGVGELEQYQGAPNPSIGFLIDDIDFSGIGTVAGLFDIERVEVLRGPQGTRYGANALGGLVYLRSTEPDGETDARVELSAASDDALSIGAAAGGELSSDVTFRISGQHYESNGFRDNATLGRNDTNRRRESSGRAKIRWTPSDKLEIAATLMFADIDNGYDAFALDNSYTMLSDNPGTDAQQSLGAAFRVEWSGDSADFLSITTLADSDIAFGFDADWGSSESWDPFVYDYTSASERERQTLSQEFRLTSIDKIFDDTTDWLVGIYVSRLDETLVSLNVGEYFDPFFPFGDTLFDPLDSDYEATNVAVFGQLDVELAPATRLVAGLRAEHRSADYVDSTGVKASPSESMLGGELSLSHDLSDAATVYGTLSAGFKAGGFNLGPAPAELREYDGERLWNLEFGVKAALQSLSINAALFYNRREDQQVRTSVQLIPGDPASFVFLTENAAEGRSLGAELELNWAISDRWQAFLSLGLLDAEFASFDSVVSTLDGRGQAHAPDYTLAAGVSYRDPSGFFASVNGSAVDAFYFDVSHDQKSDAYALADARVGYEGDSWTLSLWVRNITDEEYAVRGFFFGNEPPNFEPTLYTRLGDPRIVGMTIDWRF